MFFVMLALGRGSALARVRGRRDHFMPAALIDSQFAALEPLRPDERGMTVDATLPLDVIVDQVLR